MFHNINNAIPTLLSTVLAFCNIYFLSFHVFRDFMNSISSIAIRPNIKRTMLLSFNTLLDDITARRKCYLTLFTNFSLSTELAEVPSASNRMIEMDENVSLKKVNLKQS